MGQGNYTMLGYGVINPPTPEIPDDEDWEGWPYLLNMEKQLRSSYEAEPDYLVVPLMVSDAWLADHWKIPSMDHKVFLLNEIGGILKVELANAEKIWKKVIKEAQKHGVEMPPASLLLVSDYD